MAQQKILPQTKEVQLKHYQKKLKDDINSMVENFLEIIKLAKVDTTPGGKLSQTDQELFEAEVRAANIVRSAESLLGLIADIKQFRILNDFSQINNAIMQSNAMHMKTKTEIDSKLWVLRDEVASELFELEEEYYLSSFR